MNKKTLSLLCCGAILLGGFAGCTGAVKHKSLSVPVTDSNYNTVTDADGNTVTTQVEAQVDKSGKVVTQAVTDKSGNPVKDKDGNPVTEVVTVTNTAPQDEYTPEGWVKDKQTARLTTTDGRVQADFDKLNYTSSQLESIQTDLKKIVTKGLKSGEVTSCSVKGKSVTVTGYGIPVGSSKKTYYKLYCLADSKGAYLVTFSASVESDLEGDLSEVTKSVKKLC